MGLLKPLLLTLCLAFALGDKRSFRGFQVLRTEPLTKDQAWALRDLQARHNSLDFWRDANPKHSAEIMVSDEERASLIELLTGLGVEFSVKIQDVEELIRNSHKKSSGAAAPSTHSSRISFDDYHSHDELNAYIDELAATYDYVNTVSIGQSYEGRDMRVIQIAKAGAGAPNVWVEAGIHAREWISPAVAAFVISELVENYDAHPDYVDKVNIHVIPVANPDGYEYTRSDDRLWRKTRSDTGSALGCLGVDPNRNYDYHWGESGVSNDKCSDIYPGAEPFSEIESQNMRDYLLAMDPAPTYANALHSAAELWLYPYGYAYNTYPDNVDEMIPVCDDAVAAIEAVHGIRFVCEHSADLYPAAGDANDWYTGVIGARLAYTTELRDQGFGFVLPPEQIIPSGEEIWAAYKVALDKVIEFSNE